jgi:hypothetical protein
MKWFKKKKKAEKVKLDFSDVRMKLNIRSICYYETVRDKSFFSMDYSEEDMIFLVYSMLHENNDIDLTFEGFIYMLEDERVMSWCMSQLISIQKEAAQLNPKKNEGNEEKTKEDIPIKMTDLANYLIIKNGMDVRYVMNEMKLWELANYMETASAAYEERLTEKRLFTYLTILPNIDGKKLGGPENLLPLPWDKKEERQKDKLEKNANAAVKFLGGKKNG